jgi:hypothetical protein
LKTTVYAIVFLPILIGAINAEIFAVALPVGEGRHTLDRRRFLPGWGGSLAFLGLEVFPWWFLD